MRSRLLLVLTAGTIALFIFDCALLARGHGGGGRGGGGVSRGGGSFSRGGGSISRGSGNFSGGERNFSRSSGSVFTSGSLSGSGSFSRGGGGAVSPEAETISPAEAVEGFPEAAVVLPAVTMAIPLDITVLRTILRCSRILAARDRLAEERHRIHRAVSPVPVVYRR